MTTFNEVFERMMRKKEHAAKKLAEANLVAEVDYLSPTPFLDLHDMLVGDGDPRKLVGKNKPTNHTRTYRRISTKARAGSHRIAIREDQAVDARINSNRRKP